MKQNHFVLFPWGMISRSGERAEKLLESIRDCGFNASCFVNEEHFGACRRLGLDIYFAAAKDGAQERELPHELALYDRTVSEQQLRDVMLKVLESVPEDVRCIYITDESGAALFPRIKVLADCVREKTPWAEAYINLFPNYAVCGAPNISQLETETYEEYLDRFAQIVQPDYISIDNYYAIISNNFTDPKGRESYFSNMVQVREVCDKYDIPFQFIACCNQLRPWQTIPTFSTLAFQGYTGLAAGARAFSWFLYFGRGGYLFAPIDDTTGEDIKTATWYLLKEVNRRILALGNLLFPMQYRGLFFSDTTDIPRAAHVSDCAPIRHFSADRECVFGHYVDQDGKDVILVVNADMQYPTTVDIDMGGDLQCYDVENAVWRTPLLTTASGKTSPLWLEPGCGIALRLA